MADEKKEYWRPNATADCVVFNYHAAKFRQDGAFVNILLIKRKNEPFKDCWALPGGFLDENETFEECCARELMEEAGVKIHFAIPIDKFDAPGRDPRHRTISYAFYTVKPSTDEYPLEYKAGDDASECGLFNLKGKFDKDTHSVHVRLRDVEKGKRIIYTAKFKDGPYGRLDCDVEFDMKDGNAKLAFDHAEIIARAIVRNPDSICPEKLVDTNPAPEVIVPTGIETPKPKTIVTPTGEEIKAAERGKNLA